MAHYYMGALIPNKRKPSFGLWRITLSVANSLQADGQIPYKRSLRIRNYKYLRTGVPAYSAATYRRYWQVQVVLANSGIIH